MYHNNMLHNLLLFTMFINNITIKLLEDSSEHKKLAFYVENYYFNTMKMFYIEVKLFINMYFDMPDVQMTYIFSYRHELFNEQDKLIE